MSKLINAFDTETTGLPDWKSPSESEHQPHLIEIAAILHNEQGAVLDSYKAIVRPDGWTISEEISRIHGITHEMAMDVGISEAEALEGFLAIHARASIRVAHNATFDDRIIRIAMARYHSKDLADSFKTTTQKFCTCYETRGKVGLASNKLPTLGEAYRFYTGEELDEAHRAMPDAQACARIYFALQGVTMPGVQPAAAVAEA